jgi:transposase
LCALGHQEHGMIKVPGTRVYLACCPVDMRRGFDGLSANVAELLKPDPYSGHLFIFRSKRGDYLKILYWDGSGLCLFAKRLEKGKFAWPSRVDATLRLTPAGSSRRGDRLAQDGCARRDCTAKTVVIIVRSL